MVRPHAKPHVHERGNDRLDAVLDYVRFAARPMPLVTLLDEAPRRIAAIFHAEICSLYLLEGQGALVMRGNIGFDGKALGKVKLAVGEGITGLAVEFQRPISADRAEQHGSYKHFAVLGEERFPVFLAVPIVGKEGPLGAVVVQRKTTPFSEADVELLTALGAQISAGVRTAELLDAARSSHPQRKAGGGTRKVTLTGRPEVGGRALGAVAALRRPMHRQQNGAAAENAGQDVRLLRGAFDVASKAIEGLARRAIQLGKSRDATFLGTYVEILSDQRFRERALEHAGSGAGVGQAMSRVAREVTRTAASISDPFLAERARDVEDLCDALAMLAVNDKRAEVPSKAILIGDGLSVFDLLITARSQPVAIALSERAVGPRTHTLLELLGVPAIADVQGLYKWASDGDIALLDGDHGILVLNPSKSEVAAIRQEKRDERASVPASRG
jgi:phosphotransferase system enzyme I (PtsP)